jgi:hypothetical protein
MRRPWLESATSKTLRANLSADAVWQPHLARADCRFYPDSTYYDFCLRGNGSCPRGIHPSIPRGIPLDIPNELLDPRLLDPPAWEAMDCRGRVSRLCGYLARVELALFTLFCWQSVK